MPHYQIRTHHSVVDSSNKPNMDYFDPQRADFKPYGLTCVKWIPKLMHRPDHHNEIELNLLVNGAVTYLIAGMRHRVERGSLAAFWAASPHQIIDLDQETEYYVVTIPFNRFMQFTLPDVFVKELLSGKVIQEDVGNTIDFEIHRFKSWINDLHKSENYTYDLVMLELHARICRMALNKSSTNDQKVGMIWSENHFGCLNNVEKMICLISQKYREPLTVNEIGKELCIHPNYAMNLFKKAFGITINQYITNQRISHAKRLLITSEMKIVDIAFDSGFRTLSRFNAAFKNHCDCTPNEYRLNAKKS
ncbi:MAG: helix-turn-helix domain-containing protein [Opitutales bacterium]|nr:helix-turn-helix domain-containing protein [Opitutales bacterium]